MKRRDGHAFLIMSRAYCEQLNLLLRSLDYNGNYIYLHVDKKWGDKGKEKLYSFKNAFFTEVSRITVNWAAFSQVEAELVLLNTAVQDGPYRYYHLLSEADLPIKSNEYIHNFFRDKRLEYVSITGINREIDKKRIRYFYPMQEKVGKKHGIYWLLQKILVLFQKLFRINRLKYAPFEFIAKGSNWFSITDDFASYIVQNKLIVLKFFKKGQAVDEVFVQTLLMNSNFKKRIADSEQSNLRFIEWEGGNSPKEFVDVQDIESLKSSDKLFARKFNLKRGRDLVSLVIKSIM